MGQQAPRPPDFLGLAREQAQQTTAANRPDITTPFGTQTWEQTPGGGWTMQTGFGGPLAGAALQVGGQAAAALGQPLDLSGLPGLGTGEQARQQAIEAAYGQAASRLDPMWARREEALRTQLLGQGLDPTSEAYRGAMGELGTQRTDAYQTALNAAIGQGTAAGQALFGQNLTARQQALAEALRGRAQPLEELAQLQGFLAMPGVQQTQGAQLLPAGIAQSNADIARWQSQQQMLADTIGGGAQAGGALLQFLPFLLGL